MDKIIQNSQTKIFSGRRISFYLTILLSILITFIILVTASYFVTFLEELSGEYDENLQRSTSTLIFGTYASAYKNNDFKNVESITDTLIKNNVIKYAYVIDNKKRSVIWSTNNVLDIKANSNSKIIDLRHDTNNYTLVIGYIKNAMQTDTADSVIINMRVFVFVFLLVGFILSILVSSLTNRPIIKLVKGVQEFTKGNFDYRLKTTGLIELNELIDAYNTMAGQLQELYASLEAKVQERTQELEKANTKLKETQAMMVHSEKMRSLGELVAGIAHEINNPINFIYGNIIHLERYSHDMLNLISLYSAADEFIPEDKKQELQAIKKEIDIDFLKDDIQDLIKSCKEGTERTKNIILNLRNFSRLEEMVLTEFDIPKEIDTTLNILNNKYKNRITVHKNYSNPPKIEAYGGQLNQVFMNILDNAQYAIKDEGDVYINITSDDKNVTIQFKDTGKGIEPENLKKIFEPFYTTKPVGEGTGLGMSIAYKVIENHDGIITAESTIGEGTTFTIVLPINHAKDKNE